MNLADVVRISNVLYFGCHDLILSRDASQGGKILTGGGIIESEGNFVQPTIVEISPNADVVKEELFAPVLYVMKFKVALFFNILGDTLNKVSCFSVMQ